MIENVVKSVYNLQAVVEMEKMKSFFAKAYNLSLLIFTLVILAFSLAGYAVKPDENVMFVSQILQLFAFSVVTSLCICVSDFVKVNAVIKHAVRFVLVYASFAVFFFTLGAGKSFMANDSANKVFTVVCLTLMFVGVYVVVAGVVYAFNTVKSSMLSKNSEYKNQFDDLKD